MTVHVDPELLAAAEAALAAEPGPACSPDTGGWIATVQPEDATGVLREAYDHQVAKMGRVTGITKLGSLYPDLVAGRLRLYDVVEATPSAIPDWARRAVVLTVSVLNGCDFCRASNTARLESHGRGELARAIHADPRRASSGDAAVDALLAYARKLTVEPAAVSESDVAALRAAGWTDLDILDVNNLTAYYAYINRITSGLGLR